MPHQFTSVHQLSDSDRYHTEREMPRQRLTGIPDTIRNHLCHILSHLRGSGTDGTMFRLWVACLFGRARETSRWRTNFAPDAAHIEAQERELPLGGDGLGAEAFAAALNA